MAPWQHFALEFGIIISNLDAPLIRAMAKMWREQGYWEKWWEANGAPERWRELPKRGMKDDWELNDLGPLTF